MLNRFRGLRDRGRVDGSRHFDRLFRDLPDRKERAQNDCEIDSAFKNAAFLFFRADEQRVGRFESFGGESLVFHIIGWLMRPPIAKRVPPLSEEL